MTMKALLIIAFFAFSGISYGQIRINTEKLKENTEKKLLKQDKKKKKSNSNSLTNGTKATQTNRKRPGGTLNNNSNSREVKPAESTPVKKENTGGGI